MDNYLSIVDFLKTPAHPLRLAGGCRSSTVRGSSPEQPLVSVTTIVLNRKEFLPKAISSVINQSYPHIEYVIVDGASTDGTLDVIRQFDDKIDLWISEPDSGTAHAANKAISLTQGDIVFWLSSDDWIEPEFIERAVNALLSSGADFVFGDMAMYKDKKLISLIQGDQNYVKRLLSGNPRFNFPSMVIKKACFHKLGLLDTTFRICNDYEWTVRLHLSGGYGSYESALIVHRETGGIADEHPCQSLFERLRVLRLHNILTIRAVVTQLPYLGRRVIGYIAKLFLPNPIYKNLKRIRSNNGGL